MRTPLRHLLILVFLQLAFNLIAQKDNVLLINEFGISVNQTGLFGDEGNAYGYSLSAYHTGSEKKHLSWVYGVEFNSTNIYINSFRFNRWYWDNNMSISTNSVSIPLLIRVGITPDKNKLKLFGEAGVRLDYKIWTHMKGITDFNSGYPDIAPPTSTYFEGPADKTTTACTVLPSVGLGVSYRLNKVDIILKTDYRLGFGFILFNSYTRGDVGFLNISLQVRLNHK